MLAKFLQDFCAGAIQPHFKWRLHRWALVNTTNQDLRLGKFSIDLYLQSSDQRIGLVLVGGQNQRPGPAGHTFHVGAQVVVELGWALADRPVDPANQGFRAQFVIDLGDQCQRIIYRCALGQFDVQIHLVAVGAREELQGQCAEAKKPGHRQCQSEGKGTQRVTNGPIE